MKILINHDGKDNYEVIGANQQAVLFKSNEIMAKVEQSFYKKSAELFVDIFKANGLNDAEKMLVFHTVSKILESTCILIHLPKKGPTHGS